MDKIFGPGYQGDPGVPHSGTEPFEAILWGTLYTNILAIWEPHFNQATSAFNWHDLAMVCENHRMKRALKKREPYVPKWNQMMNRTQRTAYYYNWPVYFP
ncbi:hypothetical protein SUGI_0471500 [Cryptomeria japonica]|uniref:uncharacterized protein LOC131072697 n=1 Tax=Cryptomeria japonica TaxID=3369 RepID=UPI0024089745|nr:uncharacterized protein LOC131072697 [Cryptomeria japonica]GLJ24660.1 hypothetical protein SUGI_0471500 [Cryptomeria japonica]